MTDRFPFTTESVPEINAHLQERLKEVEENFNNSFYPQDKPRSIRLDIVFEPSKKDPTMVTAYVSSETKLPKRLSKMVPTVVRNGKILVERSPEDTPLFPENVTEFKGAESK